MIVTVQFSEIQNIQVGVDPKGEPIFEEGWVTGRRQIEMPDVITKAEQLVKDTAKDDSDIRLARIAMIREELLDTLGAALGGNQPARTKVAQLTAELKTLKAAEGIE